MAKTVETSRKISGRGFGIVYAVPYVDRHFNPRSGRAPAVAVLSKSKEHRHMSRKHYDDSVSLTCRNTRGAIARLYSAMTTRWPSLGVTGAELLLAVCVGIGWGVVLGQGFVFAFADLATP